jgi:hypothetical protein
MFSSTQLVFGGLRPKIDKSESPVASEPGSKDARLLRTYGSSCIDLPQMMEQFQVPSSHLADYK